MSKMRIVSIYSTIIHGLCIRTCWKKWVIDAHVSDSRVVNVVRVFMLDSIWFERLISRLLSDNHNARILICFDRQSGIFYFCSWWCVEIVSECIESSRSGVDADVILLIEFGYMIYCPWSRWDSAEILICCICRYLIDRRWLSSVFCIVL